MSDESCEIDVDVGEPNRIEVIVKEHVPPMPRICQQWNKVKHRRTDADNQRFLELHPECDLHKNP